MESKLLKTLSIKAGEETGNNLFNELVPYLPAAYR